MLDIPAPLPKPANEPVLSYAPGSPERKAIKEALAAMTTVRPDIPHVVGGKELHDGEPFVVRAPHNHELELGRGHHGGAAVTEKAIAAALAAAPAWAATRFEDRARVFERAASLLAGPFRQTVNAATMLGQSKTVFQAEIDAACELVDFLRFNVYFASRLAEQPTSPSGTVERAGASPARRVRARDDPVQLHRHRGQPADGAGSDGQRRRLEARAEPSARSPSHDEGARGRWIASGRHQPRSRRGSRA